MSAFSHQHLRHGNIRGMLSPFDAQAMVLAAGRGERMRPLTDFAPKPMLQVRGQPLMQWPMKALARGGFVRHLVNTAWLGEQIPAHFGKRITWSGLPEVAISMPVSTRLRSAPAFSKQ